MTGFWIIVCHLLGDYILQSDWMAENKTKRFWPAYLHAFTYCLPFIFLTGWNSWALNAIFWTHLFIDRYRLARYVVWAKNWIGPRRFWFCRFDCHKLEKELDRPAQQCGSCEIVRMLPLNESPNGYPPGAPAWLTVWLLIIADNALHLLIAGLAITYL